KGPLSLSLRGVNDHAIVPQPKAKPELSDEERQQTEKVQKELDELRLALAKNGQDRQQREKELAEIKEALAKKLAEQPPPPPPARVPEPKQPETRYVYIYRPLLDQRPPREEVPANAVARTLAQKKKAEDDGEPR